MIDYVIEKIQYYTENYSKDYNNFKVFSFKECDNIFEIRYKGKYVYTMAYDEIGSLYLALTMYLRGVEYNQ